MAEYIKREDAKRIIRERSEMVAADGHPMFAVAMMAAVDVLDEVPGVGGKQDG